MRCGSQYYYTVPFLDQTATYIAFSSGSLGLGLKVGAGNSYEQLRSGFGYGQASRQGARRLLSPHGLYGRTGRH